MLHLLSSRSHRRSVVQLASTLLLLLLSLGGSKAHAQYVCSDIVVTGAQTSVRVGGVSVQFQATARGQVISGGWWGVGTGFAFGGISPTGLFVSPNVMPSSPMSTIMFVLNGCSKQATVALLNAAPQMTYIEPSILWQMSTLVTVHGANFLPSSVLSVNGTPTAFNYLDPYRLQFTLNLTTPPAKPLAFVVTNPNPGTASVSGSLPVNFPAFTTVTPTTLLRGVNTLKMVGTGFTDYSRFTFDGKPIYPTKATDGSYSMQVFIAPWRTGSVTATVNSLSGAPVSSTKTLPIEDTVITYDQAARFSTQAAFGPRPDVVQHIQHIGLETFLKEQLAQPATTYTQPGFFSTRSQFMRAAIYSNSLLRLRVATALGSFIVNQADNNDFASYATWETMLENSAFGNFRDLMTNVTADARMGTYLNLAGNNVSADPNLHPNQNYARELMQLFTLGASLLNEDGSLQLNASGQPIATYDQNTLLDLTRALTGWNYATPVNAASTELGIDYSQPLIPRDDYHDQGSKTLFGSVQLPAGQGIVADRKQALDTIFQHPNLSPFVSRILIQHLVTSNPSPAYIQRIAAVFKNDGTGVRGNLSAVVSAIVMDPEARLGDTTPSPTDGFLQDPLVFQIFLVSALQQDYSDNQPTFIPALTGESFWYPPSVNGFYSPSALIPGTSITSPEFWLWNNLSLVHRSQILYGTISGTITGFGNDYINRAGFFLYYHNVPDLVDVLDHRLYHGTMPAATRAGIISYCATMDPTNMRQQFIAAIFLAMNSDAFNVSH